MRISIVGGGRWARVIATVLCSLPDDHDVTIHSVHNASQLEAWRTDLKVRKAPRIVSSTPELIGSACPDAVIVANRAGDHFKSASTVLRAGIPLLVEKPLAYPLRNVVQLIEAAKAAGVVLAASNVILFARYLDEFAAEATRLRPFQRVRFDWIDAKGETRYGEAKSYDSGVTVFDDVLPHVVSALSRIGIEPLVLQHLSVERGGAQVTLDLLSGSLHVSVRLGREGHARTRLIEIEGVDGATAIDFSTEPGSIRSGAREWIADPDWDTAPRPLTRMLTAFVVAVRGQGLDERLRPERALAPAAVADAARRGYLAHQQEWLRRKLGQPFDGAVAYATRELGGGFAPEAFWWSALDRSGLDEFLARSPLLAAVPAAG
jgi:predicted dehydrogenase